jgi:hypothetical protein
VSRCKVSPELAGGTVRCVEKQRKQEREHRVKGSEE